jgi:teichuronic acid biosynthesis glycosyltransferase TuaH
MNVKPDLESRITHVIVGGHGYDHDIPHREHRLAAYLAEKRRTADVYWIYPTHESGYTVRRRENGILEVPVPARYGSLEIPPFLIDTPPLRAAFARVFRSNVNLDLSGTAFLWYYSPHLSFLSEDITWDKIIYDCSDDHTTIGWQRPRKISRLEHSLRIVRSKLVRASQDRVLENADRVYASSERLHEKLSGRTNAPTTLTETGVDVHRFDHRQTDDRIERMAAPRLGYVGKLKGMVDLRLVETVVRANPNWTFVLVGPIEDVDVSKISDQDNVERLGYVSPDKVPSVMNALDLGLIPYRDIEFNKSVFPLKLFEYLASGTPVVGCGVPSTAKYAQQGIYRHTAVDPDAFAAACADALSWGDHAADRRTLAEGESWQSKLDRIYREVVDS